MARHKDADKRQVILAEAKRMFALQGFEATSMSGLAESIGLPVGSFYTYFDSKEALLQTIIEEGWGEFIALLDLEMSGYMESLPPELRDKDSGAYKMAFLVRRALPMLFSDLDLIAILLARAGSSTGLESKLDALASFVASVAMECAAGNAPSAKLEPSSLKAGIAVMLLGSLEAMRLIRHSAIDIGVREVLDYIEATVETALGRPLPAEVGRVPEGGSSS